MKIFVISLPSAASRRASVARQMDAQGLSYSLVDGVQIEAAGMHETGYSQSARLLRYGYPMARGEVGCFLAHQAAWRIVQEESEKCLILEDDAVISGLSPGLLASLQDTPYPMIRLAGLFEKRHKFIAGTVFAKYWGDPAGSAAYVLGPRQAARLLKKSTRFFMALDDFLEAKHLHGLHTYALLPYPVRQAGVDTHINDREKPELSAAARLKRMLVRMPIDIRKYFHRLAYYFF